MRSHALSAALALTILSGSAISGSALASASLSTGSQYVEKDLGSNDGNLAIVWEGNRLLGAGTVLTFITLRTTDPIRPLILHKTGAAAFNVVAVGQPFTPSAAGTQYNIPFIPQSGTTAFDTSAGTYYFAFSAVGAAQLGVSFNTNPIDTQEGFAFTYGPPINIVGPITMTPTQPTDSRHYEITVNTTQSGMQETVGLELANRKWLDGAGFTFIRTDVGFTHAGRVTRWSGFADVSTSQSITPIIVRNIGTQESPNFQITGIGATRTFSTRDFFLADFALASGTDMVQPGDLIGWWDSTSTGGVVPYNLNFLSAQSTPTAAVRYFFTGATPLVASGMLGAGTSDSRSYSIAFETAAACNVDFDQSGSLSVQDIFAFLNAWFGGDPRTDFNGNGLSLSDVFDFLNAWFAGC